MQRTNLNLFYSARTQLDPVRLELTKTFEQIWHNNNNSSMHLTYFTIKAQEKKQGKQPA